MKYQAILNRYFKGPYRLIKTTKGLTNTIYKAYYNGEVFAVRIPKDDHALIVNPEHEKEVLNLIKTTDLDVEEVFYDDSSRIRITKWQKYVTEFKDYTHADRFNKVATLLRTLHSLPVKTKDYFDPVMMIKRYQSNQKEALFDTSDYQWIIDTIQKMDYQACLCHNDLVSGNLLFSKEKVYLIDYEYAGLNDPLFDLMSFITENKITHDQDREAFYLAYFQESPSREIRTKLLAYERFHNLLWLYWSTMMYHNRHEDLYLDIAKEKYEALVSSINKEIKA